MIVAVTVPLSVMSLSVIEVRIRATLKEFDIFVCSDGSRMRVGYTPFSDCVKLLIFSVENFGGSEGVAFNAAFDVFVVCSVAGERLLTIEASNELGRVVGFLNVTEGSFDSFDMVVIVCRFGSLIVDGVGDEGGELI